MLYLVKAKSISYRNAEGKEVKAVEGERVDIKHRKDELRLKNENPPAIIDLVYDEETGAYTEIDRPLVELGISNKMENGKKAVAKKTKEDKKTKKGKTDGDA